MNTTEIRLKIEAAAAYNANLHIRQDEARKAGILAYEAAEDRGATPEECNAAYWAASDAILPRT
jgi:hypothetical protein